jgi:plasmid stabilization system protein ParE
VSFRLVVRPEVVADLREAEAWYEEREPELGQRFRQDALGTIERLLTNPFLYSVRHARRRVRWAYTHRFPYRVVYGVTHDTVVVYAIIHTSRHDRNWRARVR